ncbi:MAG: hypothetical protein QUS14_04745 [Pyrinomonadaceae bacterium]|nr:hypothetical protein [Pyrinomonadaceae bacterium]
MNSDETTNKILRLMQADDSVDAPADSIKWAKNLFLSRATERKPSMLQRLIAVLQAEIAPGQVAFGERSASAGRARQMLFSAGEVAVDLRITSSGSKFNIRGQVIGDGFENAVVVLFGPNGEIQATADELAEFELNDVAKGTYGVTLTAGEAEIVIEELILA